RVMILRETGLRGDYIICTGGQFGKAVNAFRVCRDFANLAVGNFPRGQLSSGDSCAGRIRYKSLQPSTDERGLHIGGRRQQQKQDDRGEANVHGTYLTKHSADSSTSPCSPGRPEDQEFAALAHHIQYGHPEAVALATR